MISTTQTVMQGAEEREKTEVKRKGKFLFFFETEWWETVSTEHIGNDIYIKTDRPIRNVYLDGVRYKEELLELNKGV